MTALYADVEGQGDGPPLVLLHGFTGSTRSWDRIRPDLNRLTRTIAIDLIGHGRSPAPAEVQRYRFDACLADLQAVLDRFDPGQIGLLGYSLGGRTALQLALAIPERIAHLILESASPGIEDPLERQRRIASDEALAGRIEHKGIEAFVAEWEQQPLLQLAPHVPEAVRAEQHAQRLQNTPRGLAQSLRGMGAGQQTPVWSRLAELRCPTALIVGARDARYCAIAQRMQQALPNATLSVVADAGHTVHLDQPARFVELVGVLTKRANES